MVVAEEEGAVVIDDDVVVVEEEDFEEVLALDWDFLGAIVRMTESDVKLSVEGEVKDKPRKSTGGWLLDV